MSEDGPVGEGEYIVEPGDCLSSIAFEYGLDWRTLWHLPANSELRNKRKDPNVLLPGDRLYVPPLQPKEVDAVTDRKHKFVRKGVPEKLKLVLLDVDRKPRRNLRYRLTIDRQPYKTGQSDRQGVIELSIPPNAKSGELVVTDGEGEEFFPLKLGYLDPINSVAGVQGRLRDQGYNCGPVDGIMGPRTRAAISSFQEDQRLPVTGDLDDDTRTKLHQVHRF
jgi:N-acetylmuramoyl-L-alanine amidase